MFPAKASRPWHLNWESSANKITTRVFKTWKKSKSFVSNRPIIPSTKVGNALVMLLRNPDLLPTPQQQLAAVLLLHELYRPDPQNVHPFSSVFVRLLVSNPRNQIDFVIFMKFLM